MTSLAIAALSFLLGFWLGVRATFTAWMRRDREIARLNWMDGLESE